MSIAEETLFNSYAPNGVTTVFAYEFTLFRLDDLLVELDGVAVTSGITVAGVGESGGGNVTFATAPTGTTLVIKVMPALDRASDYQESGDLLAQTLNTDIDRLWQAVQYLEHNNSISVKLPFETAENQQITETAAQRADKIIGFDSSGDLSLLAQADLSASTVSVLADSLLTASTASAMQTVLGVSSFAKTLLDDASGSDAQTTLGISTYAKTLLDDTTAAVARTTLGITDTTGRQCILYVGSNFLPASSASLSITGASYLFVNASVGNGYSQASRDGYASAPVWSSLTPNSTCYLYVEVLSDGTLTTGHTTIAPTYSETSYGSTSSGAYSFYIPLFAMFRGNGSGLDAAYVVFIGECSTSSSAVTSAVKYANNGRSVSAWVDDIPAANSTISHAHNIGTAEGVNSRIELYCDTAEHGYSVGDVVRNPFGFSTYAYPLQPKVTTKMVSARTGSINSMMIVSMQTGAAVIPTASSWKYRFVTERGW